MASLPPPETALSSAADGSDDEDGDQCRICRFPAEADRPLRRPCACSGSIRFVHDDCLLRWLATSRQSRCEVCSREITISPLYAPNAPARLPVSEFMLGLANKVMGWTVLLLSLVFAMFVWEFVMPITTLWTWRLALSRSFAQVRNLLSIRLSASSIFADGIYRFRFMPSVDTIVACVSVRRAFVRELGNFRQRNGIVRIAAEAVAPFALWIARLETRLQNRFGGLDSMQILALHTVEASLMVVIVDIAIACIFGFVPFSLGRTVLWCISCFNFGNMAEVNSYTSTGYILFIGYKFIFSLGVTFAGMHTLRQFLRGERLLVAVFFKALADGICCLLSPLTRLPGIHVMVRKTFSLCQNFFRGIANLITNLITAANMFLNSINMVITFPLLFGWSLDICTSKMFDATIYQRFQVLWASSFSSIALHWLIGCIFLMLRSMFSNLLRPLIGCIFLMLRSMFSNLLRPILRTGVNIPFVHLDEEQSKKLCMRDPFYKFFLRRLPGLLVGTIYVGMVISVPVQTAGRLAPKLFPLDITYFDPPTKGTSFWQAPRNYAELLSGFVLLRFLICNTLKCLEPDTLVEKILRNWFANTGRALDLVDLLTVQPDGACGHEVGNTVALTDQYGSTYEAKAKRRFVAVRVMLLVVLAWLTVVVFNSAVLIFPISLGRALVIAIPQLPVVGGLRSNDVFTFAVGFCIISTIITASRDSFVYMTSGRTRLLASIICNWGVTALKSSPLLFIWIVIIPILIGVLVDFLLISPFKFLLDLLVISPFVVPADDIPVLDLFSIWFLGLLLLKIWTMLAHGTWDAPFLRAMWVSQAVLVPVTMKLVTALGVPYVLAKGLFPRFGYSDAVNSAVYHFAWLGSLAVCVLCHLAKAFCRVLVKLHDSIRDERYIIGQRLQDYTDNS